MTEHKNTRQGMSAGGAKTTEELPSALEIVPGTLQEQGVRRVAVFLDYDGTLTPIVENPEKAILPEETRRVLRRLASFCTVAVVSGRDLADIQRLVGLGEILYSGCHGLETAGPAWHVEKDGAKVYISMLDGAEGELRETLASIPGAVLERKRFSLAVHYRKVPETLHDVVEQAVANAAECYPELRKTLGKMVYELRPGMEWNKGEVVLWFLKELGLDRSDAMPVYIGDDLTDEDAFQALQDRGLTVVVKDAPRSTRARYSLRDTTEVRLFLERLVSLLSASS